MMVSNRRLRRLALNSVSSLALAALVLTASPASADDAPKAEEVEKVTVTAQKRRQNILDVGLNVSVVGGADARDRRIEQMRDLTGAMSNLDVKEQVPGAMPVITIRGVGLDDFSSTNNPSAGIYVDEVFLSSLAMMSFDVYDLERIEVMKGPQGTLYGRNSTAGAINVITAKPSTAGFDAFASAGYGNFSTFDAEGMVNAPLSDTFAVRVAAKTIQQDEGYWFNRVIGDDIGDRNFFAGRAQAAWTPNDTFNAVLKFEGQRSRSEMGQGEFFGLIPNGAFPGVACPGRPECTDFFGYFDADGEPFDGDWSGDHFYNRTPAQKAFFLPRTLTGDIFWCQGYSEPDAGSDLAALQMRAEDDGADFICNGSKIWTTHAHVADWMFCLVRTGGEGRPQEGVTFLLIDMRSAGVEVRPIVMLSGEHIQNQVFFRDVRVPKANVLGDVGRGWLVAKALLEFERGGSVGAPILRGMLARLAAAVRDASGGDGGVLADDPDFAAKLADAAIRVDAFEALELKLLTGRGKNSGGAPSMSKVIFTEISQHITELALEAAATYALPFQPHAAMPGGPVPGYSAPADGFVAGEPWAAIAPLKYLNDRAATIYAGSNEIQRNIMTKMLLGF